MDDHCSIPGRFLLILAQILAVLICLQCSSPEVKSKNESFVVSGNVPISHTDTIYENLKSNSLYQQADSLISIMEYEKAIKALKRLVTVINSRNISEEYIYTLFTIAECYYLKHDYEKAKVYISKSLKLAGSGLLKRKYPLSKIYFLAGNIFYSMDDPDSALFYLDKSLFIQKKFFKNYNFLAEIYDRIGNVYRNSLMEYDLSEKFFLKARQMIVRSSTRNRLAELANFHHLAIIYRHKKDFEKSLNYSFKAINICKKNPTYQKIWLAPLYTTIGITNETNREYAKSIYYYRKSLEVAKKVKLQFELGLYYNNLGIGYYHLADYQNSRKYYTLALESAWKQKNYAVVSDALLNLGELHQTTGSTDSAVYYVKKSFNLKRNIYKKQNPEVSLALLFLGNIYKSRRNYDSALYYYQEAFIQGIPGFNKKNISSSPDVDHILKNKNFIKILNLKGLTLKEKYLVTSDIKFLLESDKCYHLLDKVLEEQKKYYDNEYSEMINNGNNKLIYDEAIEVSHLLFERTDDNVYLRKAFVFMEKNKASLLSENLNKAQKISGIGISESVIRRERLLKARLAFYKTKLYELESINEHEKADVIKEKIFDISEQIEVIKDSIYSKNSNYIQIKYSSSRQPYKDLLNFSEKDKAVFIEYYKAKDCYYAISLWNNQGRFKRIAFTSEVAEHISRFSKSIASPHLYSSKMLNFLDFTNSAAFVYKHFLEGLLFNKENITDLIIIPDDELASIPFEATLTSALRNSNYIDFKNLPYLIKRYNINYSFSLNIFFHENSKMNGKGLIAFSYTNVKGSSEGNKWKELKGTDRELSLIRTAGVDGKFFTEKEASEEKFKKYAQSAEVIHLSIHGEADSLNPFNSKLIFNSSEKSIDDGALYYYELYNLILNSKLVVLSSCNTGVGKNLPGEGVLSLGRAFNYAGAQSIIMSLWSINDVVTSSLMEDFYKYLLEDRDISSALTKSKLKYMNEGDELSSHPVNWAGFVTYGIKNDLISQNNRNIHNLIGMVILFSLVVFLLIYNWKIFKTGFSKKKKDRMNVLSF